jgi:hypothetical protein
MGEINKFPCAEVTITLTFAAAFADRIGVAAGYAGKSTKQFLHEYIRNLPFDPPVGKEK